jgi:hypothetical protein
MQNDGFQIGLQAKSRFSLRDIRQVFDRWLRTLLPSGLDARDSQRNQELESSNPAAVNSDAEFLGWQRTPKGELFALYTVKAKQHQLYRSTVSEITLRRQHLAVPTAPPPHEATETSDTRTTTNAQTVV